MNSFIALACTVMELGPDMAHCTQEISTMSMYICVTWQYLGILLNIFSSVHSNFYYLSKLLKTIILPLVNNYEFLNI